MITDDITSGYFMDFQSRNATDTFHEEYQMWLDRYNLNWWDDYDLDDAIDEELNMLADARMLKDPSN